MRLNNELRTNHARFRPATILLAAAAFSLMTAGSAQASEFCAVTGDNYLQDSDFAVETANPKSKHWAGGQHSGEPSYVTGLFDGEFTVRKTGTQPWFTFRQRLKSKELGGKKMAFSAELKLDLQPPEVPRARPVGGGLQIMARSVNGTTLLVSTLEHEPHMGKTDWQKVQVVVQLPAKTATVDLGFLLQAEGTLKVRKPSFREVDESEGACSKPVPG